MPSRNSWGSTDPTPSINSSWEACLCVPVVGSGGGGPDAHPVPWGGCRGHCRVQRPLRGLAGHRGQPHGAQLSSAQAPRCPAPWGEGKAWAANRSAGTPGPGGRNGRPVQGESAELALVPVLSFGELWWGVLTRPPHFLLTQPCSHPHPSPHWTPLPLTGLVPRDYPVARRPNGAFEDWLCSDHWGLFGNSHVSSAAAGDLANPRALLTSSPPLPPARHSPFGL